MKDLFLIRHTQSQHHVNGLTGGWTDTGLTDLGKKQASNVANQLEEILKGKANVRLISSDLKRAKETAEAIKNKLNLEIIYEKEFRELNNGDAAGLRVEEAKNLERAKTQPSWDWIPYPRAESWNMMVKRVSDRLNLYDKQFDFETAVIVTHGNSGIAVVNWWLELCLNCQRKVSFSLSTGSISYLKVYTVLN